jgi:hypothetical protein
MFSHGITFLKLTVAVYNTSSYGVNLVGTSFHGPCSLVGIFFWRYSFGWLWFYNFHNHQIKYFIFSTSEICIENMLSELHQQLL